MTRNPDASGSLSPVKRAILEIRRVRGRLGELERAKSEPVAIIGVGLRFPGGATDMESLWDLLRNGVDAITEVPRFRWDIDVFYDPDPDAPGKISTRWAGFIENIQDFDADFFGISRREAMAMDPQQRLLMTITWEALENAGQSPHRLIGSPAGVFIGISTFDYSQLQMQRLAYEDIDAYLATGSCHSVASGRLSYFLGLQGPSVSVDTACSSSLVAVHLACQSLRAQECNLALAGGVNLILSPELFINLSKAHMMAADGRCKVFDAAADGYVRGEGAGIVVLKRLSDALRDGDRILAVIRGSAVNQDGRSNGLTAPNGPSQQAVIRQALDNSGVKPFQVSYVETHGTGTALGDPIEVQALAAELAENRSMERPLVIGSIKTNVGHLEAAAGIAGLIKVIAALQHEEIPPHLHLSEPNPYIPWKDLPVRVPTSPVSWLAQTQRRFAGVSSFGFSGTNAHVVIEEAPRDEITNSTTLKSADTEKHRSTRPLHLLNLSAKTEPGLKELVARYQTYLAEHPQVSLTDVCYTASAGRAHFDYRLSVVAPSNDGMRQKLAAFLSGVDAAGVFSGRAEATRASDVVFLFITPGHEYVNVARALFEREPRFRAILNDCDAQLRGHLEEPLLSILYPAPGSLSSPRDDNARPALFAIAYALAELWRSWGVIPALVVGQGFGELVAATVSGMLDVHEGLRLAALHEGEFARQLSSASLHRPAITLYSTRSLHPVTSDDFPDPSYWCRDANSIGRLSATIEALVGEGYRVFVELGCGTPESDGLDNILLPSGGACLRSIGRGDNDWDRIIETAAVLYARGVNIDWGAFYLSEAARKIALPTYPFSPSEYWFERAKGDDRTRTSHAAAKSWEAVTTAARQQSRQVPIDLALHTFADKWRILDHLTTTYMIQNLRELGAFTTSREPHSATTLLDKFAILPTYKALIERWLKKLESEGWLSQVNETYVLAESKREDQIDSLRRRAEQELSDMPFLLEYLERCGRLAARVLTGKVGALDTLFPEGRTELAEKLYEHSSNSCYFNAITRAAADAIVRTFPKERRLHFLEIGAGTGGTTASILPVLAPDRSVYWFTDISTFFFSRAEKKFDGYPFVRYGILDIEKNPAEQGYNLRSFDVVVAANVLHATRNVGKTIEQVVSLLRPGGVLVLYEVTTPLAWFDISTGLIGGWEAFDDGLRQDTPLMGLRDWDQLLRAAGFKDVEAFPEPESPAEILGAHVIIARAPDAAGQAELGIPDALENVTPHTLPVRRPNDEIAVSNTAFLQRLREDPLERHEMLVDYVRRQVAKVLRRENSSPIDRQRRLMDLGVDSLMAVELRNLLQTELGLARTLPATLIFDYPTVEVIAVYLEKQLFGEPTAPGRLFETSCNENVPTGMNADALAHLSEETVAEMLLKKLQTT